MTLVLAYILYCLSALWLQLWEIEQCSKKVSADNSVLLRNLYTSSI